MQLFREGVMDESPMTALTLETHAGHVQSAVAYIANGNGAIGATASITPSKVVEPPIASLPVGASPESLMLTGPPGSSLSTVIVAVLEPKLTGSKRTGWAENHPARS